MGEEGRRREQWLLRAAADLAADLPPAVVVQRIVDLAAEVSDAARACLVVLDPGGASVRFVTSGIARERRRLGRPATETGIIGAVLREGRPVRADGVVDDACLLGIPRARTQASVLAVPVASGGQMLGALWIVDAEVGAPFGETDEFALAFFASQAGAVLESARLLEEAARRQRAIEGVKEVSQALLEGRGTDDVLRLAAQWARTIVGASFSGVVTPAGDGRTMIVRASEGVDTGFPEGASFESANSISADVMREMAPALVGDVSGDDRRSQPMVDVGVLGPALFVPLTRGDTAFGTLAVANEKGGPLFSADDLLVVQTFANEAAIALEYAAIRRELERLALLEDRERIAMELHDGVVQTLFAVGLSLQAQGGEDEPEDFRLRREEAVTSIDGAIRDLRGYIFGLRPADQADRHLERALRELAASFERSSGIPVTTEIDARAATGLSSRMSTVVQSAREAVSNAVRHSGARRIGLRFVVENALAVLEVVDDGSGFDPVCAADRGNGLGNLRARAEALGGALEIDTRPGVGTAVRLCVPLDAEGAAAPGEE